MRKLKARIKTSSRDIYETLSSPVYWLAYPQFLKTQLIRENQALCPKSNEYFLNSNENKMRKNCLARAMDYILLHNNETFDAATVRTIHQLICRGTDVQGGAIRTRPVDLSALNIEVPEFNHIYERMDNVYYTLGRPSDDPLRTALQIHYEIVAIQPFSDFNKRTARTIMNGYLIQNGLTPIFFTEPGDRELYIDAIKNKEQKNYYEQIFLEVMRRTQNNIENRLIQIKTSERVRHK